MILISVSVEEKMDLIIERLQKLKIPTSHAKNISPDQVKNIYYLTARGVSLSFLILSYKQ